MALIDADAHFALWGIVLGIAGFGFWAEQKTRIGRYATGVIISMVVAMLLANLKIIPNDAPVYDSIFTRILPVAIPLLLFRADLRRVFSEGGPTVIAFLVGTVGVVLGVLVATLLVPLGDVTAIASGMYTATYTGGSANFVAVAVAADFANGSAMTSMIAADLIVTNIQTMLLIALPSLLFIRHFYGVGKFEQEQDEHSADQHQPYRLRNLNMAGAALAVAVAFLLVAAGNAAADAFGNPSFGILFTSAFALVVGNVMQPVVRMMSGDFEIGIFLVFLFLIAIAASADVWVIAETGPRYLYFATIILAIHTALIVVAGRFLKLDIRAVVIGSTACVGGVATASAIASAKGWRDLILPGILAGTLGNSFGTFLGVWIWTLLK